MFQSPNEIRRTLQTPVSREPSTGTDYFLFNGGSSPSQWTFIAALPVSS